MDCNFSESNMVAKDIADGLSREGSSRVAMYKETLLPNCYTIEASFHGSRKLNVLPVKYNRSKDTTESEHALTNPQSKIYDGKPAVYTPEIYEDMGRVCLLITQAICNALLDYYDENSITRIPNTPYKTLEGIKADILKHIQEPIILPYRPKRLILTWNKATKGKGKKKVIENKKKTVKKKNTPTIEEHKTHPDPLKALPEKFASKFKTGFLPLITDTTKSITSKHDKFGSKAIKVQTSNKALKKYETARCCPISFKGIS